MTSDEMKFIQKNSYEKRIVYYAWLARKNKNEIKNIIGCFQTAQSNAAKILEEMFSEASKIKV
jgi:hypothetical protein